VSNQSKYIRVNEADVSRGITGVYGGSGAISVSHYFRAEAVAAPMLLATYRLPPGSSEGLHTHSSSDRECGALDEFYFILCGTGELTIDQSSIIVGAGDYIYVPGGVSRGIANRSLDTDLHVHIVAVPSRSQLAIQLPVRR
jgi:oxalate decarboxylase/phosphoglucose isomerase-like protein (cupin superfamily)